jgi:hypothetical protein
MRFKEIKKEETLFYVYELSPTSFCLYDSEMDLPIYVGSWNKCSGIIRNIKFYSKNAKIMFYVKENSGFLRLNPQFSYNL